jgi:hypothetical protein
VFAGRRIEKLDGRVSIVPATLPGLGQACCCTKSTYYDPALMASYRLHKVADSSRLMATGKNVADERLSSGRHRSGGTYVRSLLAGNRHWFECPG